jgi:hypothetical protein
MNLRLLGGIAAALLCATNAFAASRDEVLEALGKCSAVSDDKARLACYDALVPHAKEALASPPEVISPDHPPTKEEQESWFGFDLSNLFGSSPSQQTTPQQFGSDQLPETHAKEDAVAKQVDSITAGVTEYSYTPFGKFIVFLDNDQVWRQIEADSDHATFHRIAKDNKVTIARGLLGSYNLMINGSEKVFKVDRIK